MRARGWLTAFAVAAIFAWTVRGGEAEDEPPRVPNRGRLSAKDPALDLSPDRSLSAEESKRLDTLLDALWADDFDQRREAERALIALGPVVLERSSARGKNAPLHVREFVRSMEMELARNYRGYLPATLDLLDKLKTPIVFQNRNENGLDGSVEAFSRAAGIRTVLLELPQDQQGLVLEPVPGVMAELRGSAGAVLRDLIHADGMLAVSRGNLMVVAPAARIAEWAMQSHAFSMEGLPNGAVEALSKLMGSSAQVRADGQRLTVSGNEFALRAAARALALFRSNETQSQYPTFRDETGYEACATILQGVLEQISFEGIEATRGLQRLRARGLAVNTSDATSLLQAQQGAVTLNIKSIQTGLALRWVERRANAPSEPPSALVKLQLRNEGRKPELEASLFPPGYPMWLADTDEHVGSVDVSPLLAQAANMEQALKDELLLFPSGAEEPTVVQFQKKIFVRGSAFAVRHALATVSHWLETKRVGCSWRSALDGRLDAKIDWNGSTLTPASMLRHLTETTGINVLIGSSPDGKGDIALSGEQAEILPRGKHTARELFNQLAALTGATWKIDCGVIILTPKPAPIVEEK